MSNNVNLLSFSKNYKDVLIFKEINLLDKHKIKKIKNPEKYTENFKIFFSQAILFDDFISFNALKGMYKEVLP